MHIKYRLFPHVLNMTHDICDSSATSGPYKVSLASSWYFPMKIVCAAIFFLSTCPATLSEIIFENMLWGEIVTQICSVMIKRKCNKSTDYNLESKYHLCLSRQGEIKTARYRKKLFLVHLYRANLILNTTYNCRRTSAPHKMLSPSSITYNSY